MKILPGLFLAIVGVGLWMVCLGHAADETDPQTKAALEAARKAAEKAGMQVPDLKKMMEEDEDEAPKKPTAKEKTPAAKKDPAKAPLTAWPDWIPAVPGFKMAPGGKKWTEEDVENGLLTGTVAGAPRDIAEAWKNAAKEAFRSVSTNDQTINGALTVTVTALYLKEEQLEHKAELELKPSKGGKTTEVKLTYTIGGEP